MLGMWKKKEQNPQWQQSLDLDSAEHATPPQGPVWRMSTPPTPRVMDSDMRRAFLGPNWNAFPTSLVNEREE